MSEPTPKKMRGINFDGEIYVLETDCRETVNFALATNKARNEKITELQTLCDSASVIMDRMASEIQEETQRADAAERTLAAQRTALLALSERIRREGMQGVANEIEEICK